MKNTENEKNDFRTAPQPELTPLEESDLALVSGGGESMALHVKLPPPRYY